MRAARKTAKVSPNNASSHDFTPIFGVSVGFSNKTITCFVLFLLYSSIKIKYKKYIFYFILLFIFSFFFLYIFSFFLLSIISFINMFVFSEKTGERIVEGYEMSSWTTVRVVPLQRMWELSGGNGGPRCTCSCAVSVQCRISSTLHLFNCRAETCLKGGSFHVG